MKNFAKYAIEHGGKIKPLLIPSNITEGNSIFNPTVLIDNGKIIVNLRQMQNIILHSEKKKFQHIWGPFRSLNPENDPTIKTKNFLLFLDNDLDVTDYFYVDTSALDTPPLYGYIGLEDARLVSWDNKWYLCGVRRDARSDGQGRIELSEIVFENNSIKEVSRFRIPAPGLNSSYCEKNWMPILDTPYHFVKWTNPTEIVKADINHKTCETIFLGNQIPLEKDLRGGSQVIPWDEGYMCIVHESNIFATKDNKADAHYFHRFVVWDRNWNIVKTSKIFSFLNGHIEFCAGAAIHNENLLITFGFQDNSSFILELPIAAVNNFIND